MGRGKWVPIIPFLVLSFSSPPQWPSQACCHAFKEFACPFADALNDEQSDCATTMFSYINLYGKYPPGLFALQCKEGKEGLDCTDIVAANQKNAGARRSITPATALILLIALLASVCRLF